MSILTLAEAQLIDPAVDQLRLDALEAMVRARTSNRYHIGHGAVPVTLNAGATKDETVATVTDYDGPALYEGDTVELTYCASASGLYAVASALQVGRELTVTLTGPRYRVGGFFPDGQLCLVQYPADVAEGVRGLLRYDVERAEAKASTPTDLKSKTVGRASETYRDDEMVRTPAGVYPGALLAFLDAHRRLSWGS